MAEPAEQWPPEEPPSVKQQAFSTASALLDSGNEAEIALNISEFEKRVADQPHLRQTAMERLRLASIATDLIVEAKGLEELGSLTSAERLYRAVVAMNEPHEGAEDA